MQDLSYQKYQSQQWGNSQNYIIKPTLFTYTPQCQNDGSMDLQFKEISIKNAIYEKLTQIMTEISGNTLLANPFVLKDLESIYYQVSETQKKIQKITKQTNQNWNQLVEEMCKQQKIAKANTQSEAYSQNIFREKCFSVTQSPNKLRNLSNINTQQQLSEFQEQMQPQSPILQNQSLSLPPKVENQVIKFAQINNQMQQNNNNTALIQDPQSPKEENLSTYKLNNEDSLEFKYLSMSPKKNQPKPILHSKKIGAFPELYPTRSYSPVKKNPQQAINREGLLTNFIDFSNRVKMNEINLFSNNNNKNENLPKQQLFDQTLEDENENNQKEKIPQAPPSNSIDKKEQQLQNKSVMEQGLVKKSEETPKNLQKKQKSKKKGKKKISFDAEKQQVRIVEKLESEQEDSEITDNNEEKFQQKQDQNGWFQKDIVKKIEKQQKTEVISNNKVSEFNENFGKNASKNQENCEEEIEQVQIQNESTSNYPFLDEIFFNEETEEIEIIRRKEQENKQNLEKKSLLLDEQLIVALVNNQIKDLNIETLPVIDLIQQNKDLIFRGQPLVGKSLAYLIGILNKIVSQNIDLQYQNLSDICQPLYIVLSSNDQQISQLYYQFCNIMKNMKYSLSLKFAQIFNTNDWRKDRFKFERENSKPHLIFTTPSKLQSYLDKGIINCEKLDYLIVDEADQTVFVRKNFENQINQKFVDMIHDQINEQNSEYNLALITSYIEDRDLDLIENYGLWSQAGYEFLESKNIYPDLQKDLGIYLAPEQCYKSDKNEIVLEMLKNKVSLKEKYSKTIIFCNTKESCKELRNFLNRSGELGNEAIFLKEPSFKNFDELDQREKLELLSKRKIENTEFQNTLRKFKELYQNDQSILITTDAISRGVAIQQCDLVICYDMPQDPLKFFYRATRCCVNYYKGICATFVEENQQKYYEKWQKKFEFSAEIMEPKIDTLEYDFSVIGSYLRKESDDDDEDDYSELK